MKRYIRQTAPINNSGCAAEDGQAASERGSFTLETAMVMPIFLLLVFFLLHLVLTSIIAMSMHGALSQTVRLAAATWYPISQIQQRQETDETQADHLQEQMEEVRTTIGKLADRLPDPLHHWAASISEGAWSLEEAAAKLSFREMALQLEGSRVLNAERFRIVSVGLPQQQSMQAAYLTIEAEYRLPFRVPFTGRALTIRSTARERVWIGGTHSPAAARDDGTGALHVKFISLEPDPVRPGRKATLVLRTDPGAVLDLSIFYKSGISQAKHLGSVKADGSGLVTWTWHVSGNTTSGIWKWQVSGQGGGTFGQNFQVARSQ